MDKNDEILSTLKKTKARREEKTLTLSTRLDKDTNELILLIATIEDRTVSKVLQRLIERGLTQYFNETNNIKEYYDFLDTLEYPEETSGFDENREEKDRNYMLANKLKSYISSLRDR